MKKAGSFKFSHFGICVSNLESSIKFYEVALGFTRGECYESGNEIESLLELRQVDQRAQWMHHHSGIVIELLYYISPVAIGDRRKLPHNKIGFTHMAFFVNDLHQAIAKITENGGFVRAETMTKLGNCTLVSCTDPDGVAIGLMQQTS